MVAELAGAVAELHAHDAEPGRGKFVAPTHVLGVRGRTHDHAAAVGVQDARQHAVPVRGLMEEERDVVAVDTLDHLRPPADAHKLRQRAEGLRVDLVDLRLHGGRVGDDLFVRGVGADRRRRVQRLVHPCHDRDQGRIQARIGGEGEGGVAQLSGEVGPGGISHLGSPSAADPPPSHRTGAAVPRRWPSRPRTRLPDRPR